MRIYTHTLSHPYMSMYSTDILKFLDFFINIIKRFLSFFSAFILVAFGLISGYFIIYLFVFHPVLCRLFVCLSVCLVVSLFALI